MSANNRTRVLCYFVQCPPDVPMYLYLHVPMHARLCILYLLHSARTRRMIYVFNIIMNNRSAREMIIILIIPHGLNATFVMYCIIFYNNTPPPPESPLTPLPTSIVRGGRGRRNNLPPLERRRGYTMF